MPPARTYDLKKDKDFKEFQDYECFVQNEFLRGECNFDNYIQQDIKSKLKYGNVFLYYNVDTGIVVKNKRVLVNKMPFQRLIEHPLSNYAEWDTAAIIVDDCKVRYHQAKNNLHLVLLDADEEGFFQRSLISRIDSECQPTVSFRCLAKMFDCSTENVIKWIISGKLELFDYTLEENIEYTKEEKKLVEKRQNLKPKLGFTQMIDGWHRSGTCLFTDTSTNKSYIFGQDEGTYFGCELPKKAKNIEDAYKILTPPNLRNGQPFERQGEWFVVEVPESEVPEMKDCVIQFCDNSEDEVYLPLDSAESNKHSFSAIEGRVSKKGKVYVRSGEMRHPQHDPIIFEADKWYTFYKNTAVRSVSQEGVD